MVSDFLDTNVWAVLRVMRKEKEIMFMHIIVEINIVQWKKKLSSEPLYVLHWVT